MKEKDKILITSTSNNGRFNELDIQRSEKFLDNLQSFAVDIGLAKVKEGEYEFDGISYDRNTFYTLFYEDPKNHFELRKLDINEFKNGLTARYYNDDIELLIFFIDDKIKLIFYCDLKFREKVIYSLLNFCKIMQPKKSSSI